MVTGDAIGEIRLDKFTANGLDRGRGAIVEVAWHVARRLFLLSALPWPMTIKVAVLRAFGAQVGKGLYIRPRVYIHFPWKLSVGDHCWIGEGCEILNLEPFTMENHSALAHFVYVAAAGHDIRSRTMQYANAPVTVREGSWIGTRAYLGPGADVGRLAVVAAGAVVVGSVPPRAVVGGVPAKVIGVRELRDEE